MAGKLLPNFRYYFDGLDTKALVGGKLHSFKSSDHSESGRIPLYADAALTIPYPNPMIADGLGCFPPQTSPIHGHAIYWDTNQQLYLRLEDKDGNLIADVDNFPDSDATPAFQETVFTNYINNSEFRFHKQKYFLSSQLLANTDNYIADEGWIFRRNNTNCEIYTSFEEFNVGQVIVPFNPKYYLHFERTSIGAGGESQSDFLQPITDVISFAGETISFRLYGASLLSNSIQLIIIQHFGTGGSPSPDNVILHSITLSTDFADHVINNITIPSVDGKVLGTNGDDRLYVGIRMPLNALANVDITLLQWNKGVSILQYDDKTPELEAATKRTFELPDPPKMILAKKWTLAHDYTMYVSLDSMNYSGDSLIYDASINKFKLLPPVPVGVKISGYTEDLASNIMAGWISASKQRYVPLSLFHRLYNKFGKMYTPTTDKEGWQSSDLSGDTFKVTIKDNGVITETFADHSTGFTFTQLQAGDPTHPHIEQIKCVAASGYNGTEYFTFGSALSPTKYLFYVVIDGNFVNPLQTGYIHIPLFLTKDMTAATVALTLYNAFNPLIFYLPPAEGLFERNWANDSTNDPDRATRIARADGVLGDHIGTTQNDENKSHNHGLFQTRHDYDNGSQQEGWANDNVISVYSQYSGGNESRPKNIYVDCLIKF